MISGSFNVFCISNDLGKWSLQALSCFYILTVSKPAVLSPGGGSRLSLLSTNIQQLPNFCLILNFSSSLQLHLSSCLYLHLPFNIMSSKSPGELVKNKDSDPPQTLNVDLLDSRLGMWIVNKPFASPSTPRGFWSCLSVTEYFMTYVLASMLLTLSPGIHSLRSQSPYNFQTITKTLCGKNYCFYLTQKETEAQRS